VVSRSEGSSSSKEEVLRKKTFLTKLDESLGEREFNELNVHIKISYKTLVFAFVTFDFIRHLIDRINGLF
jgi:hypothetical protein